MLFYTTNVLFYLPPAAALLTFGTAWLRYAYLPGALRILPWLLGLMFIFGVYTTLPGFSGPEGFPLIHVYTLLEAGLVALYFRRVLGGFVPELLLWIGFLLFSVLTLIHAVYDPQNKRPDMLPRCIESLCVIALCAASYYRILKQLRIRRIYRDPVFIINIGFLLYFSEPLFQLIIHPYIEVLGTRVQRPGWILHGMAALVLYFFFFTGLWMSQKPSAAT